jgi:hypothetical protein
VSQPVSASALRVVCSNLAFQRRRVKECVKRRLRSSETQNIRFSPTPYGSAGHRVGRFLKDILKIMKIFGKSKMLEIVQKSHKKYFFEKIPTSDYFSNF